MDDAEKKNMSWALLLPLAQLTDKHRAGPIGYPGGGGLTEPFFEAVIDTSFPVWVCDRVGHVHMHTIRDWVWHRTYLSFI